MSKKFVLTESEVNEIRKMYGLLNEQVSETPTCSKSGCFGKYSGPEFNSQGDIAHQYSNVMSKAVAAKLKELYVQGIFSKVDFGRIKMTTKGMGSGNVVYTVEIPFVQVSDKCDARTGFGHVGGWGHGGAGVDVRKSEIFNDMVNDPNNPQKKIRSNPVVGTINDMEHSQKTSTPEGLVEYWIQWRHRDFQSDCSNNKSQKQIAQTSNQTSQKKPSTSGDQITFHVEDSKTRQGLDNLYKKFREFVNSRIKESGAKYDFKDFQVKTLDKIHFAITLVPSKEGYDRMTILFNEVGKPTESLNRAMELNKDRNPQILKKGVIRGILDTDTQNVEDFEYNVVGFK